MLKADGIAKGDDGIYSAAMSTSGSEQDAERKLRENVANQQYDDYLDAISRSHSIQVMDHEVDRFLAKMPHGALVLDIGGCWGWHWRRLAETRPDVGVLIIDFVRNNLLHAKQLLGALVGEQIALMHADATVLPFHNVNFDLHGFDGVWTVQVFQHIPNFSKACQESHRVMKLGGVFSNYSLHITPHNRMIYKLMGRKFHVDGMMNNDFHLSRASDRQREILEEIFGGEIKDRYTECFFHPDLRLFASGDFGKLIAQLDILVSQINWFSRLIARQRSFEAIKA